MNNIFSAKLYLQGLCKVRTTGIAMAIVITVLNALVPLQKIDIMLHELVYGITDGYYQVEAGEIAPFGLLVMLFAPLLVYNMFSYLNDRKASDFYHALPQKRICVYISFTSAILTWIVSVLLASTLVNAMLFSFDRGYTVTPKAILLTFLGFLLLALVMAGFMALSMMLTGTAVANCLVFILFSLFIRACGMLFLYGFSHITPMFNYTSSWLKLFDWEFFLPIGLSFQIAYGETSVFGNVWFFLYWSAVAIVLLSLSAWAYCRRRSESATKSAPNRRMQNIYRIGITAPLLILGVYFFIAQYEFFFCLLCVLIAFLVWIVFELLTTKKLGNVIRSLPMLLIPVFLAGGYAASLYLTRSVFYVSTPEREQIESVKLEYADSYTKGWEEALLAATEITDPDALDRVYDMISYTKEKGIYPDSYAETVTLTLTSGKKITYNLRSSANLCEIFKNSAQIRERLLAGPDFDVETIHGKFNEETNRLIWNAVKEDLANLDDAQKMAYLHWNEQVKLNGNLKHDARFIVFGHVADMRFYDYFYLNTQYTPTAFSLYAQYYIENKLEGLQAAKDRVAEIEPDQVHSAYMLVDDLGGYTWQIKCYDFKVIRAFFANWEIDSHLADRERMEQGEIYRFVLQVEYEDSEDGTTKEISVDMDLTFSKDDFKTYTRIVANAGAMPIS